MRQEARARVPLAAGIIGTAGLIPFFGFAWVIWSTPASVPSNLAAEFLAGYGAIILSFMGGCRWGFASAGLGAGPAFLPLIFSVVPALIAWPALMLEDPWRFVVLAAAFLFLFSWDVSLTRQGGAPAWWPRLRLPLTIGAVGSLFAAALA